MRSRVSRKLRRSLNIVVTFDDGYADNLHEAQPLLEAADIPAVIFVTAGKVNSKREFWWDELERVLLTHELPDHLTLTLNKQKSTWDLRQSKNHTSDAPWHVLMGSELTPCQAAYRELLGFLRLSENDERERILLQIAAWAGLGAEARPTHRTLTHDEVQTLGQGGLIEVAAHSMTHPVLSNLSIEEQQGEIITSKQRLQEILGQSVSSFSYPYGTQADYTSDTITLVKDAGFDCACSNFPGQVQSGTDLYELPRLLVRDWDGDEFAKQLRAWFRG